MASPLTPVPARPATRNPPSARVSRRRGHIHLDLAILVFLVLAAGLFLHAGLARRSLAAFLFGAWGLSLAFGFPLALGLAFLVELVRGRETESEAGVILAGGLAGGLAGAAWAFSARSAAPAIAGFAAGLGVGAALAANVERLPTSLEGLGDMVSESVMLTALAYVLVPLALFLYAALVRPFFEHGFSDGLKIAAVMGAFTAVVLAFFWALSRFPAFSKLVVSAILFGLLFGFAAFLTLLFFPSDGLAVWKVYAALGAEAALAAAVCGRHLYRMLHDDTDA